MVGMVGINVLMDQLRNDDSRRRIKWWKRGKDRNWVLGWIWYWMEWMESKDRHKNDEWVHWLSLTTFFLLFFYSLYCVKSWEELPSLYSSLSSLLPLFGNGWEKWFSPSSSSICRLWFPFSREKNSTLKFCKKGLLTSPHPSLNHSPSCDSFFFSVLFYLYKNQAFQIIHSFGIKKKNG